MAGNGNSGGHNRKATEKLRAQGTFRPDRHAGGETPQAPTGRPTPPKGLGAIAKAEWDRMVSRMEAQRTSSTIDDAALYQYVQLFEETEQIRNDDRMNRKLVSEIKSSLADAESETRLALIQQIVQLQVLIAKSRQQLRMGHMAIRQYLVEFGMTPSARTRVKVPKATDANPKAKLIAFQGGKSDGHGA